EYSLYSVALANVMIAFQSPNLQLQIDNRIDAYFIKIVPFRSGLEILNSAKITLSFATKDFFEALWKGKTLVNVIFKQLAEAGYTYEQHPSVYDAFLTRWKASGSVSYNDMKLLRALQKYARKNNMALASAAVNEAEVLDIQHILDVKPAPRFIDGRVNKTESTYALQAFLKLIAKAEINEIQMDYDSFEGYTIQISGGPQINLNLFLKNVNFSNFYLNKASIKQLADKIESLTGKAMSDIELCALPDQLSLSSQAVISYYLSQKYRNINRLLRGEPLLHETEFEWLKPRHGQPNLLVNFLCGILVNDAARRLLDVDSKLPFIAYPVLDRADDYDVERIKRMTSNPQKTPEVKSFSVFSNGSPHFNREALMRTKLQASGMRFFVIKGPGGQDLEGEVLLPGGQSFIYEQGADKLLYASLANAPIYDKAECYLSDTALIYAYHTYLKHPYKLVKSEVRVGNQLIQRPNHGLPYTYRVKNNIQMVLNYFLRYAKDEGFRLFCKNASNEVLEDLKLCAVFSVTGRESEVSAEDDLQLYQSFRMASCLHCATFIAIKSSANKDHLFNIIEFMGHPKYETFFETDKRSIYMHRIVTTARNIDLLRCYTRNEFIKSVLEPLRDLSETSDAQTLKLNQMVKYCADVLKVQGNGLCIDANISGELAQVTRGYEKPFDKLHTCLHELDKVTATVPYPEFDAPEVELNSEQTQSSLSC
ncbi:MAG: SidE phosphodiesterase domain-containing protein, partial [Legionella sp.]|nr:SidE phosphodiesterase domain-containing protein [Legionella sp.]